MMFSDLTQVNVPFGLLDDETKLDIMAHSGPLQILNFNGAWEDIPRGLHWQANSTYRVKAAPTKPRECWSYGAHLHDTLAAAEKFRADVDASNPGRGYLDHPITKWVEVMP